MSLGSHIVHCFGGYYFWFLLLQSRENWRYCPFSASLCLLPLQYPVIVLHVYCILYNIYRKSFADILTCMDWDCVVFLCAQRGAIDVCCWSTFWNVVIAHYQHDYLNLFHDRFYVFNFYFYFCPTKRSFRVRITKRRLLNKSQFLVICFHILTRREGGGWLTNKEGN